MRYTKLALATLAIVLGLVNGFFGVWAVISHADCRGSLGEFSDIARDVVERSCGRDLQVSITWLAWALVLGLAAYFLLRSRWRKPAALPSE
jgi:hypothetical protein